MGDTKPEYIHNFQPRLPEPCKVLQEVLRGSVQKRSVLGMRKEKHMWCFWPGQGRSMDMTREAYRGQQGERMASRAEVPFVKTGR